MQVCCPIRPSTLATHRFGMFCAHEQREQQPQALPWLPGPCRGRRLDQASTTETPFAFAVQRSEKSNSPESRLIGKSTGSTVEAQVVMPRTEPHASTPTVTVRAAMFPSMVTACVQVCERQ